MTPLILLTAPDCHLCEHGKHVLNDLGVPWQAVDEETDEGGRLAAGAPPMRPVLYTADGRLLAYGRLSLKRLRKHLAEETQPA